jgi:hypothetical protein
MVPNALVTQGDWEAIRALASEASAATSLPSSAAV